MITQLKELIAPGKASDTWLLLLSIRCKFFCQQNTQSHGGDCAWKKDLLSAFLLKSDLQKNLAVAK